MFVLVSAPCVRHSRSVYGGRKCEVIRKEEDGAKKGVMKGLIMERDEGLFPEGVEAL